MSFFIMIYRGSNELIADLPKTGLPPAALYGSLSLQEPLHLIQWTCLNDRLIKSLRT
jgi:hypothetical protein